MKKTLLFCVAALLSLMASAGDGLTPVGANVILVPSTYWDGDIEWKAWTWVYNSGNDYGEWNERNPNYNMIVGEPEPDANGLMWFEPGFDMGPKEDDQNYDTFEPIFWEEQYAPYSSDETFNGRPSYQWTGSSIIADIYVRRFFTTNELLSGPVYLACGHDDAPAKYYLNGELVYERTGTEGEYWDDEGNYHCDNGWNNAEYILLTDEQKALINRLSKNSKVYFEDIKAQAPDGTIRELAPMQFRIN